MLSNHQLPFFVVYSMSSSCNWQIPLWPCSHVFLFNFWSIYLRVWQLYEHHGDFSWQAIFKVVYYNPSTSNLHFYTLLPLASVYIKYSRQIIFLMVLILNFLVCINLQNLNNPHTCSVTYLFLFNDCHAPLRGPQDLNAGPGVGEGGFLKLLKKLLLKLKTGQMAINFALTCSSAILMCFTQSTDTFLTHNWWILNFLHLWWIMCDWSKVKDL